MRLLGVLLAVAFLLTLISPKALGLDVPGLTTTVLFKNERPAVGWGILYVDNGKVHEALKVCKLIL
jgi:hypothetical protein